MALLLSFSHIVKAQDFKSDLKGLYELLGTQNNLSTDINIRVVGTPSGDMVQKAKIRKSGENYYYQLEGVEMFMDKKNYLMVDNSQKVIVYRPITHQMRENLKKQVANINLDTILGKYDSVTFHGIEQGLKHYTVTISKSYISKAEVYLNADTKFLNKVVFYYSPKMKVRPANVTVSYSSLTTASLEGDPQLKVGAYFVRNGKQMVAVGKYKGYKIKAFKS
jgi:hypothetical protein